MSGVIARALNALFRTRWGVALVLAVVVLAVVGVGRLFSDGKSGSPPVGLGSPGPGDQHQPVR